GQSCSRKRERAVRQMIEIVDSRIEIGELGGLRGARRPGGQQVEIAGLQRRLDGGQERGRRARRKRRRVSRGGAGRKVQGRLRQRLVGSLLVVVQADVELGPERRYGLELRGFGEMLAGRAVSVDDSLG